MWSYLFVYWTGVLSALVYFSYFPRHVVVVSMFWNVIQYGWLLAIETVKSKLYHPPPETFSAEHPRQHLMPPSRQHHLLDQQAFRRHVASVSGDVAASNSS